MTEKSITEHFKDARHFDLHSILLILGQFSFVHTAIFVAEAHRDKSQDKIHDLVSDVHIILPFFKFARQEIILKMQETQIKKGPYESIFVLLLAIDEVHYQNGTSSNGSCVKHFISI